jgi:hypothetical protein
MPLTPAAVAEAEAAARALAAAVSQLPGTGASTTVQALADRATDGLDVAAGHLHDLADYLRGGGC